MSEQIGHPLKNEVLIRLPNLVGIERQAGQSETAAKATKTLNLTDKTTFQRSGKAARLDDVKVGDRVVIDVPVKTTNALLIQIGATAKPAPHK